MCLQKYSETISLNNIKKVVEYLPKDVLNRLKKRIISLQIQKKKPIFAMFNL